MFVVPENYTITDAFVLDGVVAVQVNETEFIFYPIPLNKGTYVNAIKMKNITNPVNNFTDEWKNLLAYSFGPNRKSKTVNFFGILNTTEMVKINYTYNEDEQMINHTVTKVPFNRLFNVSNVDIAVTNDQVIISVADGA